MGERGLLEQPGARAGRRPAGEGAEELGRSLRGARRARAERARAGRSCSTPSPTRRWRREVSRKSSAIGEELEEFRLRSLLSQPDDFRDAQLEISAGAGGTEAQDWAQMLMRMYTRWAERKGYAVEIVDMSEGEEAGIKGAVLEIKGLYAYGYLKAESGRAPARAHLAVRLAGAAAHELRLGVHLSRGRHGHQHRDSRRGPEDRRLPRVGRGRPARQQDQLRGAHHAHPDAASSPRRSSSGRSTRTRRPRCRC